MDEKDNSWADLKSEANKFCSAVGLHDDLLMNIRYADSDWSFILQVDALLETSIKEVVMRGLKMEMKGISTDPGDIQEFVEALPVRGKTSLLMLLRASGCPKDFCDFIEATRKLRNSFAHNIRRIDDSLLTVIYSRSDSSYLLKRFAHVETGNYDEQEWVNLIKEDEGILRFVILSVALKFLVMSYHIAIK